jgi:isoleucyl-tRNA synthetase
MSVDYKSTIFLPRTDFPMKGGLPQREPEILARWAELDLYKRLREISKGREKFVLHDGPPYANGNIHMGTALNKVLKDVINRSQQMLGKDANYVPGWDCHGLPIEWKIEEEYRAKGKDKDAVPIVDFRRECRDFALHWIDVQREEFKRLGVIGDWDDPYTTMAFAAEAQIAREIGKFLMNGSLYKGAKPVMWSVVEKTALAEAEVEYHDHVSKTIWVRFPIVRSPHKHLVGKGVVIWTTTPWTIPGNRGIAYGAAMDYALYEVREAAEGARLKAGEQIVIAAARQADVEGAAKVKLAPVERFMGRDLAGTCAAHPLRGRGYDFDVPLMAGEFVTAEDGTGFVHMAPGHGVDDFELCRTHNIAVPETVAEDGAFYPAVPLFAGKRVYLPNGKEGDANEAVIAALAEAGNLLARGKLTHSYPHSWRSKAPLIFRTTAQWFIAMDDMNQIRQKALDAIDATNFYPAAGKNRLGAMIAARPDWCISRQRAWGVPIPVFVNKHSGEPLRDQKVVDRVAEAFEQEGADAWFSSPPARFLGNDYNPDDFEQVKDIADVWFDSGSTHAFVLEVRPDLKWPASLYLEGTDQHRGWFHSSLLESCGTRGRAPYDGVLTHGFVMAEDGRKMSKSLGNNVAPQTVVQQYGADILRLWVVASDYSEDLRIGPEIIKQQVDVYRRLRNTLRYLLGNLADLESAERLPVERMSKQELAEQLPELERWLLHRLASLDQQLRRACDVFEFHGFYAALHNFCTVELSAFYFDIRKDSLYCDRPDSQRRRAARTLLDVLFDCIIAWLAPVLCFTTEEAWSYRHGEAKGSVHLRTFPDLPESWRDDALDQKWQKLRALRRVVTGALERERAEKRIGSSLQASPLVYATPDYRAALEGLNLAEIAITSEATLAEGTPPAGAFTLADVAGVAVVPRPAEGGKCERCWRVRPEVGHDPHLPGTCRRCADAVGHHPGRREAAAG